MSHACSDHPHPGGAPPAGPRRNRGVLLRTLAWLAGFVGLYSLGGPCPFCGRPGCPTGAATFGLAGLVFVYLAQWGRSFRAALGRIVQKQRRA